MIVPRCARSALDSSEPRRSSDGGGRLESGVLSVGTKCAKALSVKLRFRIAVLTALVALGSCLWRPPVIPPLATGNDAGVGGTRDASAMFSDTGAPPAEDASPAFTDREACDNAARANDGAAPSTVLNDGRVVICGSVSDAMVPSDASASADSAPDASPVNSDAGAVSDASASDGATDDGATDDGAADAGEAG
jgi:hypothetical protein